jgi:DNA-directed RNA polymerase subunit N (RpoN/RPB10)
MVYLRCPSCNTVIANRYLVYKKGINSINNNPSLNDDEKTFERQKLLLTLDIYNYCCRMRIMGTISKPNIVK